MSSIYLKVKKDLERFLNILKDARAMGPIIYALLSVLVISLISLVGIFTFLISRKRMGSILMFLVSFSAGSLFASAFLHLLPEAFSNGGLVGIYVLAGISFFFVLEKFVQWRHCHIPTSKEHPHPFAYMNLVGDTLHNMIDGMIIGGAYLVSIPLGLSTSLAIIFHEIPQEIGDFGVLLHGGFKRGKALAMNFLTALSAFIGVGIGLALGSMTKNFNLFIVPFTAGGFIYIAGSDLIPELHKESKLSRGILQLFGILLGIGLMALFGLME